MFLSKALWYELFLLLLQILLIYDSYIGFFWCLEIVIKGLNVKLSYGQQKDQ